MSGPFLVPKPTSPAPAPAPATTSDDIERSQALDATRSWVVEAPAGSGKTGLIIQRYLKLLADPGVSSPEQVLAITFTLKAATELQHRVIAQLESASRAQPPQREFDRITRALALAALERSQLLGWDLLAQPHRLNIRTIDSVCGMIARSLPILSGSGGSLSPVEDAGPLYALAAHRTFQALGSDDRPLHTALHEILLHRDGQLADAEALLAEMLRWREQWGELIPLARRELDDAYLDATVLPKLEHALQQAILTTLHRLVEVFPPSLLRSLASLAHELSTLPGYKDEAHPLLDCIDRPHPPEADLTHLPHWRALHHLCIAPSSGDWRKSFSSNFIKVSTGKNHQDQLKTLILPLHGCDDLLAAFNLIQSLPPAEYPREQWLVAKSLFRILSRALVELQLVFAERGECDFTEFALAARTALASEDPSEDATKHSSDNLAAGLGVELQHLLVDEMQDTSSGQYDLIQSLTAGWDGHSQTLFLVGDPKQSIYLFRQARVERFLRVLETSRIGDIPLGRLALTANFRSQANLVHAFNADFTTIFNQPDIFSGTAELHYQPATPRRAIAATADDGRIWHRSLVPARDSESSATSTTPTSQRLRDATAIRHILAEWRDRPLPADRTEPWKLAVLVRSRSHLKEIIAALQQSPPIPYRAIDIEPLRDRREVKDLVALTRALLHPADRIAWLSVLRAPWCGLTLADLHKLTGEEDATLAECTILSLLESCGHNLSSDGIARLERIWPYLTAAIAHRACVPLAELIERTWLSLGGDTYLRPDELLNSHRYLHRLDELERAESGPLTAEAIERSLKRLFAAPVAAPDAVDLLTIHGAKGLEWDLVCVPALERRASSNRSKLLSWLELDSTEEQSAHILLAPIQSRGAESKSLNKWLNQLHVQRESAELRRLYYVACTRAREALHLFASPQAKTNGEPMIATGSLLQVASVDPINEFTSDDMPAAITPSQPRKDLPYLLDIAAAAETAPNVDEASLFTTTSSHLERLPIDFNPTRRFEQETPLVPQTIHTALPPSAATFTRPDGSFQARAIGNAVHAFLEQLTGQITGQISAQRAGQITEDSTTTTHPNQPPLRTDWTPRITALLRSEGLPTASVASAANRVQRALNNTLEDPTGRWILSPHPSAKTEYALVTAATGLATVRIDRTFLAGKEPLSTGDTHHWIIDYKTTVHAIDDTDQFAVDRFLTAEQEKYRDQLHTYADRLASDHPICLALYYPELKRLIWWPYPTASGSPLSTSQETSLSV